MDRFREFTLLVRHIALRVVREELGQDQQAVQRRTKFVTDVGKKLGLVARCQRELFGLVFKSRLGMRDLAVFDLNFSFLNLQKTSFVLKFLVGLT